MHKPGCECRVRVAELMDARKAESTCGHPLHKSGCECRSKHGIAIKGRPSANKGNRFSHTEEAKRKIGASGSWRKAQAAASNNQIPTVLETRLAVIWPEGEREYQIGRYRADVALPEAKIAIEADGEYWHRPFFTNPADVQRDAVLATEGWTVIRLSEAFLRACVVD